MLQNLGTRRFQFLFTVFFAEFGQTGTGFVALFRLFTGSQEVCNGLFRILIAE